MTTDPSETRRAEFRLVFRGYDPEQVNRRLDELAAMVTDVAEQRDRLAGRLGELADRDLKLEFEKVGQEVASVLEAARVAAESMRDRASADAARWRSESMAEAEAAHKAARVDAEALRTDAWTTGSQLLEQAQAEAERIRATAERDSLSVLGEAEREAHRLTSSARREAEELVRGARMEAEKLVSQAKADHDEIIATAHRQAEAAQERTRALEQRRQELMTELESVRTALASFEGELEERRQGIGLSQPTELPRTAVVYEDDEIRTTDWEEGHTVRVIRPSRSGGEESRSEPVTADEADGEALAAEVARLRSQEPERTGKSPDEEIEVVPDSEEVADPETTRVESPSEPAASGEVDAPPAEGGDVFDLFRRLRQEGSTTPAPPPSGEETGESSPTATEIESRPATSERAPAAGENGIDPFEIRDRLLLPITNQALRAVKRVLTESQNEALDEIRVKAGEWEPSPERWRSAMAEDLEGLAEASAVAGTEAAREFGLTASVEPRVQPPDDLSDDLAAALASAVATAGGPREKAAAASRVFRGWRTDEAERRVRVIALRAYHDSLAQVLQHEGRSWQWRPAGRLCPRCRAAAETEGMLPPAHPDCSCTVVPV